MSYSHSVRGTTPSLSRLTAYCVDCIASLLPCTETHILLTSHIKHGDLHISRVVNWLFPIVCVLSVIPYVRRMLHGGSKFGPTSPVSGLSNNGSRTRKQRRHS